MIAIFNVLLLSCAVILGVPTAILWAECLLGLFPRRPYTDCTPAKRPKIAVVVPAHDESSVIGPTIEHLHQQLVAADILLVVADNCGDDTARIAKEAGATVIERTDPEHRGKGYALAFAAAYLKDHEVPEAVVIIDADCRISDGGISQLASLSVNYQRPVQADDTLNLPLAASPGARMSAFAFRVRNRIRPRGLQRMGGAVHLAGTGMAFPWEIFAGAPSMGGHLTEDLALGIELILSSHSPMPCVDVHVTSDLAPNRAGQAMQRQRWESGHLQTLARCVPRLFAQSFVQHKPSLLLSACDLAIPPPGCARDIAGGSGGGSPAWLASWNVLDPAGYFCS